MNSQHDRYAAAMTTHQIIREHNSLNGLRLVVIEFLLVLAAAALFFAAGLLHRNLIEAIAAAGIAANAIAVIVIAIGQIRNRDQDVGLTKALSAQSRADIAREHPNLGRHTVIVMVSVLVPFLLLALLLVQGE